MSILVIGRRLSPKVTGALLLSGAIELLEKSNLLGDGELFHAAFSRLQAEPTAIIRTPLAMMTI
jgi:hypothetical protein